MFQNRSFTVVVALALLGVVTLIFGTAIGTPTAAPSGIDVPAVIPARPVDNAALCPECGSGIFVPDLTVPERRQDYAELKEAQLEQRDATQFAGANITAADEADPYPPMQPPASGWWVYRDDSLTNGWYAHHYSMTPTGLVIDETYEYPGKSRGAVTGCGLDRTEPDC